MALTRLKRVHKYKEISTDIETVLVEITEASKRMGRIDEKRLIDNLNRKLESYLA